MGESSRQRLGGLAAWNETDFGLALRILLALYCPFKDENILLRLSVFVNLGKCDA
jgi:hypothetical protein